MADLMVSSASNVTDSDICMTCGACCATYRVSFYWGEGEALGIPETMTSKVNDFYSCMKGTEAKPVRCIALKGEVGKAVACQIYDRRSSTCQSVQVGDEQCRKARQMHGLTIALFNDEDYSKPA